MAEGPRPERWEYRTIEPPRDAAMKEIDDPSATLDELGADGWELVATLDYDGGGTKYLVFKRPATAGDVR